MFWGLNKYLIKIPKGIKFQFGAFLLIYIIELIFRLLFVIVSVEASDILHVLLYSTVNGFPLDVSIVGYLMLIINVLFVLGNLCKSKKNNQFGLEWFYLRIFSLLLSILLILHVIVLFSDVFLFHYWQWRINSQAIAYLFNWEIILQTLPAVVLVAVFVLLGIIAYTLFKLPQKFSKIIYEYRPALPGSFIFILPIYFVLARGGIAATPINLGSVLKEGNILVKVSSLNGVWNALYSISNIQSIQPLNSLLVNQKFEDEAYNHYYPNNNLNDSIVSSEVKAFWLNDTKLKPDVHLIILEGINQHWLERNNSPLVQLKKLGTDFLSFSRCYAVGDRTDKGLASLIGGWPGEPGPGILYSPDRWNNLIGLANVLKSSNYASEFWYGGDDDFANTGAFLKSMGFDNLFDINFIDQYYSKKKLSDINIKDQSIQLRKIKWGFSDISTAEAIINTKLKSQAQHLTKKTKSNPVFRTWLTLSTHEPFDIVGDYLFKSDEELFVSSMKHLDSAVFNYINSLVKDKNVWNNSLVIIVSDHGKVFGLEDVPWSESEFFRIPLMIGGGALRNDLRGKKWNSTVSQSDLYATLSYMLTNRRVMDEKTWGRPMFNFNGFQQALCFKGDYSLLIDREIEDLGHIQESINLLDTIELRRRSLQSKIIRNYFRFLK